MTLPPLLNLQDVNSYRAHYEAEYVNGADVVTPDGVHIQFYKNNFDHAFYKTDRRTRLKTKNIDETRLIRMDWIRFVVNSTTTEVYKRTMPNKHIRRIIVEPSTGYAVICELLTTNPKEAVFITAYIPGAKALSNIRSNPKW